MRLSIETADNGIIIRGEDPDDVYLALDKAVKNDGYGCTVDHSDEYKAIGRRIYSWLMEELSEEHHDEMCITGFDLEINAWVTGRER